MQADRGILEEILEQLLAALQLPLCLASLRHVPKDHDRPDNLAMAITNGSRTVLDRDLRAVPGAQRSVIGKPYDSLGGENFCNRVINGFASIFVEDPKDPLKRLPARLAIEPSSHRL